MYLNQKMKKQTPILIKTLEERVTIVKDKQIFLGTGFIEKKESINEVNYVQPGRRNLN